MDEKMIRERLDEIAKAMSVPPSETKSPGSHGSYLPHISGLVGQNVEQLLDYLRLRAKYLSFDLEATRRENRYLRKMLERRTNLGEPPDNL